MPMRTPIRAALAALVMALLGSAAQGAAVVSTLTKFPGYTGTLNVGVQSRLTFTNLNATAVRLTGVLRGLQANSTGGIQVHTGSSCGVLTSGPNYWAGASAVDPWVASKWTSNATGVAKVNVTIVGYNSVAQSNTVGRVLIVDQAVNRTVVKVACGNVEELGRAGRYAAGTFQPVQSPNVSEAGSLSRYHTFTGTLQVLGAIRLQSNNVLVWKLSGLEPNATGGIHIHEGTDCLNAGGHFYDKTSGVSDPWNAVQWRSTSTGRSAQVLNVSALVGAFPFESNKNRAVVIHASNGTRVACGVLANVQNAQGHATAFEVGNSLRIQGWAENLQGANVKGAVRVSPGSSCAQWTSTSTLPANLKYDVSLVNQTSVIRSRSYYQFTVPLTTLTAVSNRPLVLFDSNDKPIACGVLKAFGRVTNAANAPSAATSSQATLTLSFLASAVVASMLM